MITVRVMEVIDDSCYVLEDKHSLLTQIYSYLYIAWPKCVSDLQASLRENGINMCSIQWTS